MLCPKCKSKLHSSRVLTSDGPGTFFSCGSDGCAYFAMLPEGGELLEAVGEASPEDEAELLAAAYADLARSEEQ